MDPRTAFALSTAFAILNGGILGLMHRGLSTAMRPAAADWRIGTLLVAGGTILLSVQNPSSAWLVLPSGNTCLFLGFTLYWRSLRRFDGVADSYWLFAPAAISGVGLTWFVVVHPILWVRVIIASTGWSITMLSAINSLFKNRPPRVEIGRMALASMMIILTTFMILRSIYFAVWMRDADSILAADNIINILTPISVSILPVIGTTAFLVMCSERLRGDLAMRAIELDQKNIALTEAIRAREDAERIARHDLKTPLASIAATPNLLRATDPQDPEHEELLGMIETTANRALSMVNLSLDLYRIEKGIYEFQAEPVDLTSITRAVIDNVRTHAQSKQVKIRLHGGEQAIVVAANESLCYSCVANLLKNAVEAASDYSTVEINISIREQVQLSIHNDTAVPNDLRERFFEKYATAGKLGGTGLGTYSSYVMAQAQGGSLRMETGEGIGTTVTLELDTYQGAQTSTNTLPAATVSTHRNESKSTGNDAFGKVSVLVVDDDTYNCKVLCSQLAKFSLHIETAPNGRYAVEHVLAHRPDIIFMDIEMPVMGGIQAMQAIRELQRARRQEPSIIIAFSSDDNVESQARFLSLGFDSCLSKPASSAKLSQQFQGLLQPEAPSNLPAPVAVHIKLLPEISGFLASRLQLLDQLVQAAEQQNQELVRGTSHKLGGSLGMYGFAWAADQCKQIENDPANTQQVLAIARGLTAHLCTVPIVPLNDIEQSMLA